MCVCARLDLCALSALETQPPHSLTVLKIYFHGFVFPPPRLYF